jgi:hypothetical protein
MKLTYRGDNYESNPPALELTEGEIGGKYRGANWRHHYPRHIPVPQPVVDLKYRGVDYCIGDPVDVEAVFLRRRHALASGEAKRCAAASATDEAMSTVSSRQEVMDKLTNTHLTNIRQSLEHRLQVAQAKGDQNLIRLLEVEAKQIV